MSDITINSQDYSARYASLSGAGPKAAREVAKTETIPPPNDPTQRLTSPVGIVDPASGVYVLQFRDSKTGEVQIQYPSAKVVNAYKQGLIRNIPDTSTAAPGASGGQASSGSGPTGTAATGSDGSSGSVTGGGTQATSSQATAVSFIPTSTKA